MKIYLSPTLTELGRDTTSEGTWVMNETTNRLQVYLVDSDFSIDDPDAVTVKGDKLIAGDNTWKIVWKKPDDTRTNSLIMNTDYGANAVYVNNISVLDQYGTYYFAVSRYDGSSFIDKTALISVTVAESANADADITITDEQYQTLQNAMNEKVDKVTKINEKPLTNNIVLNSTDIEDEKSYGDTSVANRLDDLRTASNTNKTNVATNTSEITKIKDGTTTVNKALKDSAGNTITETYETKAEATAARLLKVDKTTAVNGKTLDDDVVLNSTDILNPAGDTTVANEIEDLNNADVNSLSATIVNDVLNITLTTKNGTVLDADADLTLHTIVDTIVYDEETKIMTFTFTNGQVTNVDLTGLIDVYSFEDSDNIDFTATTNATTGITTVTASIKATVLDRITVNETDITAIDGRLTIVENSEATREANETTRIANEDARISNETTRVSQELVRVSNENERIAYFNAKDSTLAKVDGVYPNMQVGLADNLNGDVTNIKDTFIKRITATDNNEVESSHARPKKISGITEKIMYSNNFEDTTGIRANNATIAATENILTLTLTGAVSELFIFTDKPSYNDKKIYIEFETKANASGSITVNINGHDTHNLSVTNSWQIVSAIFTPNANEDLVLHILSTLDTYSIKNLIVRPIEELGDSTLTAEEIQYKYGTGYKATGLVFDVPDKIVSTGKNLFDGEWEEGDINRKTGIPIIYNDRMRTKNFIKVKPQTAYIFTMPNFENGDTAYFYYDINKNFISVFDPKGQLPFVTPNNCEYIKVIVANTNDINQQCQLELGSTATEYEPYHEDIFTIPQPTIAEELSYSVPSGLRNYVEFIGEKKYFHKVLDKVDLGTLEYDESGVATISDMSTAAFNPNLLSDNYLAGYNISVNAGTNSITVVDTVPDISGYLIYPLETEVVTEITDYTQEVYPVNNYGLEYILNGYPIYLDADYVIDYLKQIVTNKENAVDNTANIATNTSDINALQNKVKYYSCSEFASITRVDNVIYGVYNETTGVITFYYGSIGV